MKILVTGGAGFIGSHLVDALAKTTKNKIVILDNFHRGNRANIEAHLKNNCVKVVKGDIRRYNDIKKIGDVDIIYHLAAQSNIIGSFQNPEYALNTNILGTYNILSYAAASKVKKLIFTSSREVYGNPEYIPVDEKHPLKPINLYGATKVSGEALCDVFMRNFDLKILIARIANAFGPRDKDRVIPIFVENALKGKNLELFGGNQVLDFIWIYDVIRGIIKISENEKFIGEAINLGTGVGTSVKNLAKKIIKLTNSKSKIVKKNLRNFDVNKFVSNSAKLKIKTLKLDAGLKKTLEAYEL